MIRLVARDICQYFDQKHRYEFTFKPLNYYERQKIIFQLKYSYKFVYDFELSKLDKYPHITIGNRTIQKYTTKIISSVVIDISLIYKLKLLTFLDLHINLKKLTCKIGKLKCLTYLGLHDTELINVPSEIIKLKSLKTLNITCSNLRVFPSEICKLTSLTYLRIGNSNITNIPSEICQLSLLKRLYLNDNQLIQIPAEVFKLTSLKVLDLSYNNLTNISYEICKLKLLEELHLQVNQITNLPLGIFKLSKLKFTNFRGNTLDHNTRIAYTRYIWNY